MNLSCTVLTIVCCAIGAADAAPLWDVYPNLICRYDQSQICDIELTKCSNDTGGAILSFDFRKSEMRSFADQTPRKINGRFFYDSKFGDTNTVLEDGALFSFLPAKKGLVPGLSDTIIGFAQSTSPGPLPMVFTAHMTCHPT